MNPISLYLNLAQDGLWLFVLVCLAWLGWTTQEAVMAVACVVRGWRHRRYVRARDAAYEAYGLVYWVGSPPSHRAAGARP